VSTIEVMLLSLLFMKGCTFGKYTSAASKKELKSQDFFGLLLQILVLYKGRLSQFDILLLHGRRDFTIHIVGD
jgi:hypothetical protein